MKGQIGNFLSETKEKITYTYDFGDNWEHQITVNKVMPDDPSIEHPECLLAQRACPPEDCGGIPGYMSIVRIFEPDMADELDEDDEGLLEWVGEDFDPEYVDINKINQELSEFWM